VSTPRANPARRTGPIQVRAETAPDAGQLRHAITARLAGRPWPAGVEATVAQAVADAVSAVVATGDAAEVRP
jgi:hypothetical protein